MKSGGRLAVSDIVTTAELPAEIKGDLDSLASCISGASTIEEVKEMLRKSGFVDISVEPKDESRVFIKDWVPGANINEYIQSAVIRAIKK